MRYAIYGTVYNSISTLEKVLNSVYKPEYDITIVDSYSSDGTYEKLCELKKEYNLRIFRLKSSRGYGRAYALRHCPEKSRTAYIDLDVLYNDNFHKLMKSDIDRLWVGTDQQTFFVRREEALKNDSWLNLNTGEIENFLIRNRIKVAVPAIIGFNDPHDKRESRYENGIRLAIRKFNNEVDWIRGESFVMSRPYTLSSLMHNFVASLKGKYTYAAGVNNCIIADHEKLHALTDPAYFDIPNYQTMFFCATTNIKERIADRKVEKVWGTAYKFIALGKQLKNERVLIYVKDRNAMKNTNRMAIFTRWTKPKFIGVLDNPNNT